MRKYFLLSAAALMAATNVNAEMSATADYAQIGVSASVSYATKVECSQDLSFGNVVVNSNITEDQTVRLDPDYRNIEKSSGIADVIDSHVGMCDFDITSLDGQLIGLDSESGDGITARLEVFQDTETTYNLGGTLNIYPDATPTSYSATLTVIKNHE
ncbi:MAG: hypothetical protein E7016_04930 [Alphaproteobacteria bacterium]|nr:hypothetical protein [Alphaproteobacteria bacterium]